MMGLLTLYARREPTTDSASVATGLGHKADVVLYADKDCTQAKVRWPWYFSNCPTRRNKYVTFNCWRWKLEWAQAPLAA